MRLDARIARLEATGPGAFLSVDDCDTACARYAEAHASMIMSFPNAMPPAAYRTALETTRDPMHQRVFACWMRGDEDL
ncbi:hypothetical protein U1701_17595 [Sphingomonas sp. PB2P19]|uniref:hypothetical protein n=1 Tax=Sphingomonas rhamnosi TaxID=3096156 RepID=UPI002FC81AAC